jgi:hypothetical protein
VAAEVGTKAASGKPVSCGKLATRGKLKTTRPTPGHRFHASAAARLCESCVRAEEQKAEGSVKGKGGGAKGGGRGGDKSGKWEACVLRNSLWMAH